MDAIFRIFFSGAFEIHFLHEKSLLLAVSRNDMERAVGDPVVEGRVARAVAEVHHNHRPIRGVPRIHIAAGFPLAGAVAILVIRMAVAIPAVIPIPIPAPTPTPAPPAPPWPKAECPREESLVGDSNCKAKIVPREEVIEANTIPVIEANAIPGSKNTARRPSWHGPPSSARRKTSGPCKRGQVRTAAHCRWGHGHVHGRDKMRPGTRMTHRCAALSVADR